MSFKNVQVKTILVDLKSKGAAILSAIRRSNVHSWIVLSPYSLVATKKTLLLTKPVSHYFELPKNSMREAWLSYHFAAVYWVLVSRFKRFPVP